MSEIRTVKHWDELPPVVQDGSEHFSTRALEQKHRKCHAALVQFARRDRLPMDSVDLANLQKVIEETQP